jgi:hypothetical protein
MITSMLSETQIMCPYCGETNELTLEITREPQSYYQDCLACCRPIRFELGALEADGSYALWVQTDSE